MSEFIGRRIVIEEIPIGRPQLRHYKIDGVSCMQVPLSDWYWLRRLNPERADVLSSIEREGLYNDALRLTYLGWHFADRGVLLCVQAHISLIIFGEMHAATGEQASDLFWGSRTLRHYVTDGPWDHCRTAVFSETPYIRLLTMPSRSLPIHSRRYRGVQANDRPMDEPDYCDLPL